MIRQGISIENPESNTKSAHGYSTTQNRLHLVPILHLWVHPSDMSVPPKELRSLRASSVPCCFRLVFLFCYLLGCCFWARFFCLAFGRKLFQGQRWRASALRPGRSSTARFLLGGRIGWALCRYILYWRLTPRLDPRGDRMRYLNRG